MALENIISLNSWKDKGFFIFGSWIDWLPTRNHFHFNSNTRYTNSQIYSCHTLYQPTSPLRLII